MKVFVTGPTGVLGTRVTRRLLEKGFEVVGLTQSTEKSKHLRRMGAHPVEMDLFDTKAVIDATKGCQALLHLATSIPRKTMPRSKDWADNDRIRLQGTQNLLSAARENEIDLFLCQSITALNGQQDGQFVTALTPQTNINCSMLHSASEMEKMVKDQRGDHHLILRFGTFYSKEAFHTNDMLNNIRRRRLPIVGDGLFYWNFIHLDDAARAVVFGLEKYDQLRGRTLNITDFAPILHRDLVIELAQLLGARKPVGLPRWLVRWAMGKDIYAFLTNSYRIEPELNGFRIEKEDFITEISKLIEQR